MKSTAASAARQSQQAERGRAAPYRLVVLAPEASDAASAAGGLIVDALRAGWRVELYLETVCDSRAPRILGVSARTLPSAFDFGSHLPDAVAFAASMFDRHRGIRRFITEATRRNGADVVAWGGSWPTAPSSASSVGHHLSAAACAFKHQALKAVDAAPSSSPVESFHGRRHPLTAPPG
ncbi:hypothetical protein [Mycolicibacterium sp. XJ1819]